MHMWCMRSVVRLFFSSVISIIMISFNNIVYALRKKRKERKKTLSTRLENKIIRENLYSQPALVTHYSG